MDTQPVIMVQVSDRVWTMNALHSACQLARNFGARLVLVQMIPVQHAQWLGSDLGNANFTQQERATLKDYEATIEDYGIDYGLLLFQYESVVEAITQAAEHVNAQIVFARIQESRIPFWSRFQKWALNRQLNHQNCQWYQHPIYDPKVSGGVAEAISGIAPLAHRIH
jgi:hypothetical protein